MVLKASLLEMEVRDLVFIIKKSNLVLETQSLGAYDNSSFMAARFPPSGMNAGSEYLSSSGSEFAFEEIPLKFCRAKGDCIWETWRGAGRGKCKPAGSHGISSPCDGLWSPKKKHTMLWVC